MRPAVSGDDVWGADTPPPERDESVHHSSLNGDPVPGGGPSDGAASPRPEPLSIGEVLPVLTEEFPDVTISKIRFLESKGLVRPERNASGYRQFSDADIERLRWILRQQRDHFLPLKVIRRALERGVDVIDAGGGEQPTLWTAVAEAAAADEVDSQRRAVERDEAAEARRSAARSGAHPARAARDRHAGRPGGDTGRSESGSTRPKYSTPADVVAALQEDPRTAIEMGSAGRAGESDKDRNPPEPVPADPNGVPVDTAESPGDRRTGTLEGAGGAEGEAIEVEASGERRLGVPRVRGASILNGGDMRELSRDEVVAEVGLGEDLLDELIDYGLVEPVEVAGEAVFDQRDLAVTRAALRCAELGITPRHLRMYKVAAVREAGLFEQLAMPMLKQRNPDAKARAVGTVDELAGLGAEVHALLLGRELGPHLTS